MQLSLSDELTWSDDAEVRSIVAAFPGGLTRESVAWYLNVTVEQVERLEEVALRKLRRGGVSLRDLMGGGDG